MLLRYSVPVLVFIGALALTGWAFIIVENHKARPNEMGASNHGPLSGMLHLMSERQAATWHRVASNAVSAASGSEVRRAPSDDDGDARPTPGYFERARMLLFLLRSRHWRKLAHHETPQAEHGT
ncbi:MAG: hypothetical protein BGP09_23650 [Rhizobium sp. 60-20]|jgi:hypothetical protein|nr:MAG: hypothetical protein BGP09_23650 [Rhizobium sp. 60-20]RKD67622.1 hypothetical protein BJ928_10523 [Rhizobium sp. WW_1]